MNIQRIAQEIYRLLTSRYGIDEETALDLTSDIIEIIEDALDNKLEGE